MAVQFRDLIFCGFRLSEPTGKVEPRAYFGMILVGASILLVQRSECSSGRRREGALIIDDPGRNYSVFDILLPRDDVMSPVGSVTNHVIFHFM